MRRVVVTGLGAVTPIGNNVEEFWNGIKAGKCGIDKVTLFDATDLRHRLPVKLRILSRLILSRRKTLVKWTDILSLQW